MTMAGLNELNIVIQNIVISIGFVSTLLSRLNAKLPVSLEYIIGGGKLLSVNCRCRGCFVLVNKCKTMQIRPASTAIPVETPNSDRELAEVSVDMSEK